MKVSRLLFAAMALLATPALAVEPTARDGTANASTHEEPIGDTRAAARAAVMRLLTEPAEGVGPSVLVLKGIKAFIKSGRAYEQCGVPEMDAAVERNLDSLLTEFQDIAGADSAALANLLKTLAEGIPQRDAVPSEAIAAFSGLRVLYETVAEPLKAATEQLAEALYDGSPAEQGVVWSNEQVANACAFISGYLAGNSR